MIQMNLFTKQTHRLERMGRVGEGTVREFGIDMVHFNMYAVFKMDDQQGPTI